MRDTVQTNRQAFLDQSDLNNRVLLKLVSDYWKNNDITISEQTAVHEFMVEDTSSLYAFTDQGEKLKISGMKVWLKFQRTHYFGYLDDLNSTIGMRITDETHGVRNIQF